MGDSTVDRKLAEHEQWAPAAVAFLVDWLREDPAALVAIARGRHAEGSYRYGDRLMYEYGPDELLAEAAQELGDAINYVALRLRRLADAPGIPSGMPTTAPRTPPP